MRCPSLSMVSLSAQGFFAFFLEPISRFKVALEVVYEITGNDLAFVGGVGTVKVPIVCKKVEFFVILFWIVKKSLIFQKYGLFLLVFQQNG